MNVDKDLLIMALGTIITVLGYFLRTLISRLDKVENRVNIMVSTQLSHDKDISAIKEIVKEFKDSFKENERKRDEFLAQIPQKFNEVAGIKFQEIIMEIKLLQHRVGVVEEEKKH